MSREKKHFALRVLRLISVMPLFYRLTKDFIYLLEDEAEQAIRRISIFIIALVFMGMLMATMWLCLQALIAIYLVSLQLSWLAALSVILIFNFLISIIVGLLVLQLQKWLFFPKSRKFLLSMLKK